MINPTTPGPAPDGRPFGPQHTPYEALGGDETTRRIVDAFYDHMDADPAFATIRALHDESLVAARDKLYMFLSGWLGGPPLYTERFGHPRLRGRHAPFPIGEVERDQWLACMAKALDDVGIDGAVRAFLDERFRHVADFMRNR
ncbi:MAG: group II truncated hemoglobin [Phycisphaerales bacterium]|nr:group II truncated hemoglobin [Phycisphaerales bacterium]